MGRYRFLESHFRKSAEPQHTGLFEPIFGGWPTRLPLWFAPAQRKHGKDVHRTYTANRRSIAGVGKSSRRNTR